MTALKKKTIMEIAPKTELDAKLDEVLKAIDKKLKALGYSVKEKGLQYSCISFKYNELDSNNINISTSTDLSYLTKALALMKRVKADILESNKEEKVACVPVWLGHPVDQWIANLSARVKQVGNANAIQILLKQKEELTGLMSAEQKLFNALQATADILKV